MKLRPSAVLKKVLPFALVLALLLALVLYPHGGEADAAPLRVVRVWQVDTFEGGKGSRVSFLKKIARLAEKEREGVSYLISSYTVEGARAALGEGTLPDALSFGVGLSDFAERSLPLPYSFAGGEVGGDCLAFPWCRGGYALFSLTDDFSEAGGALYSQAGRNLISVAAAFSGVDCSEDSGAYVRFLSGECRYLLGTQRDRCRFAARGVAVYEREIPDFCDLYQYFSVLNAEKRADALFLLGKLLSEEGQGALGEIGMSPVGKDPSRSTVSVFSTEETLGALARAACTEEGRKILDKSLKRL